MKNHSLRSWNWTQSTLAKTRRANAQSPLFTAIPPAPTKTRINKERSKTEPTVQPPTYLFLFCCWLSDAGLCLRCHTLDEDQQEAPHVVLNSCHTQQRGEDHQLSVLRDVRVSVDKDPKHHGHHVHLIVGLVLSTRLRKDDAQIKHLPQCKWFYLGMRHSYGQVTHINSRLKIQPPTIMNGMRQMDDLDGWNGRMKNLWMWRYKKDGWTGECMYGWIDYI